ncbi:MAG: Stp1/IreP family PP2C-type Ser/Thr phosphatase [Clostridia bacterium]|nr:Stp1/IreP family PP2C-type Ser/Thr phosphatase [Clostridia bacterium]MBR2735122.1 Stp1/IreP family PP2C-type Ser/Thr phosphatase [Clostridia bacterium]
MKIFSKSDIGKKRTINQDSFAHKVLSESMSWSIVCDGMGGLSAGELASGKAVKSISDFFQTHLSESSSKEDIKKYMFEAARLANEEIYKSTKENPELGKMGTTLVMCIVKNDFAGVAYLGDSRAYLLTDESISQISVDHSVVQQMLESGEITPEQAKNHPQKNIITRALGIDPTISLDYKEVNIPPKVRMLLCTDGLTNYLDSLEILDILKRYSGESAAEKLIEESNNRGGKDNITVSIIET